MGYHCVGAKVNGSIVPLSYKLQMGDRVEILTQKRCYAFSRLAEHRETPSARSKIRSFFAKISRSDDMQEGRDILMREMRKHGFGISSAQSMRAMREVAEAMGYKDADDMLVNIGTGKEAPMHVANRMLKLLVDNGTEDASKPLMGTSASSTGKMRLCLRALSVEEHETHSSNGVVVHGIDDVLVRLSVAA